ncbi:isoamylase early set domain-containing protein [Georgenia faecalis]|uniref:Isoamylase early set domain-containing protein n=1 Tax=Georgenia faecalis TaxID=2483799 RepID=A0ABV9DAU9_9MICO|nr:isoamylase early set domain-containing protein [Georgenia faecalis]
MIKKSRDPKTGAAKLTFILPATQIVGTVSVVGTFNDWTPGAHVLRRRSNGTVSTSVLVEPGQPVQFRYLATGGVWFDDESADAVTREGSLVRL